MKKMVVINRLNYYNFIDFKYLENKGLQVIPLLIQTPSIYYKNGIVLENFNYTLLLNTIKKISPDYICSMYDGFMLAIAKIRETLNLPGLSYNSVQNLINKNQVYKTIDSALKIPKTILLSNEMTYSELTNLLMTDTIFVKPHSKSGSEAICIISSEHEFLKFKQEKQFQASSYIAQEYIQGTFYHCELIVQNDEIKFLSARQYSAPNHKMITDSIPLFSIDIDNEITNKIIKQAAIIVQKRMAFNNGIMHIEFYLNKNMKPIFIEANIRNPGIWLNKMYHMKLGISFETLMLQIEAGIKLDNIIPDNEYYICGYYPILPGTVKKINYPSLTIKHELDVTVKIGYSYDKPIKLSKAAAIVAWDNAFDKVFSTYQQLNTHRLLEVE
ncbi:MAG: hypothetical protein A3E87_09650 [Gammaproteobacteria bacterium RIFCSPHIGHO2_12_FULL_35_23]|nr:MAG: hypothetical protein A3E87_09650 [Gammaproteobacteria bacterium RIFCSPHIGHO2_12_FULL_35_23]